MKRLLKKAASPDFSEINTKILVEYLMQVTEASDYKDLASKIGISVSTINNLIKIDRQVSNKIMLQLERVPSFNLDEFQKYQENATGTPIQIDNNRGYSYKDDPNQDPIYSISVKKLIEYLEQLTGISDVSELSTFLGYSEKYFYNMLLDSTSLRVNKVLINKLNKQVEGFSLDGLQEFIQNNPNDAPTAQLMGAQDLRGQNFN